MKKETCLNLLENIRISAEENENREYISYAIVAILLDYLNDKDIQEKVDLISF